MRDLRTIFAFVLLVTLVGVNGAWAEESPVNSWNTNSDGVVLGGFDVVSYFTEDRAVLGSSQFVSTYLGGKFFFSSAEHRAMFEKDPSHFAPRFGGHCAFGVATQKAKAPVDPHSFKIYNGNLLLFYNDLYQGHPVHTKVLWNQDEKALFAQAAKTWPTLN